MNNMTDRDRLIELIYMGLDGHNNLSIATMRPFPHYLADGILTDGWIRPPCKVGDTVYKVMDFKYVHGQVLEIKVLRIEIQDEMRFYAKTVKHYRYNYIWFDNADFGKTVFFTKEEAEAKLKEFEHDKQLYQNNM